MSVKKANSRQRAKRNVETGSDEAPVLERLRGSLTTMAGALRRKICAVPALMAGTALSGFATVAKA